MLLSGVHGLPLRDSTPSDAYALNGQALKLNGQFLRASTIGALAGNDLADFTAALRSARGCRYIVAQRTTAQSVAANTSAAISMSNILQTQGITATIWTAGDPTKLVIPSELNGCEGFAYGRFDWAATTFRRKDLHVALYNSSGVGQGYLVFEQQPDASGSEAYEATASAIGTRFTFNTGDYLVLEGYNVNGAAVNCNYAELGFVVVTP